MRTVLERYPPLQGISPEEWDGFFHTKGRFTEEDDEYIRQWYDKDHIISLAYALGRTPWNVSTRARLLGLSHNKDQLKEWWHDERARDV